MQYAILKTIYRLPKLKGGYMTKKRDKVKPDVELKTFWRDNEHFADLCNAVLFHGAMTVKAEDLQELDSDMSGIIFLEEKRESILRTRDVAKKIAYGMEFMIVGIENQINVHYAMPLRVLLYDGLGYLKQCEEIKTQRRDIKEIETADEFIIQKLMEAYSLTQETAEQYLC